MNTSASFRTRFLTGLTVGILAHIPVPCLFADDHGGGGGGGGHHGEDDGNKTEFLGTIQGLPASGLVGVWNVDGRTVRVSASTNVRTEHGDPVMGSRVEIEGPVLADGSVRATTVKTEDAEHELEDNVFFGRVQSLPDDGGTTGVWRVGGLTILVDDSTRIETEGAELAGGALVRVEGVQQPDGSIAASEIEIQSVAVAAQQGKVRAVRFEGVIEHLPETVDHKGNWVISGVVVTVTDDSVTRGSRKPRVGRTVKIAGQHQINDSFTARQVDLTHSH